MDLKRLFHTAFIFWIILDPLGNIPVVISLLKPYDALRQRAIVLRELFFSLLILLIFFFFGLPFFSVLGIEQSSLQVAGSLNFFLIGVKMLFPKQQKEKDPKQHEEPFLVPIATPAIVGPGIISTVMLYGGNQDISNVLVFFAILIAWIALFPFLLGATFLKKLLKENGLIAVERLFAYLVILIAVQMGINGLTATFSSTP